MKLWVGVIELSNGPIFFLSRTEAGLQAQIADFCREWWTVEETSEDGPPDDEMSDAEIIEEYFLAQGVNGESLVMGEAELDDDPVEATS